MKTEKQVKLHVSIRTRDTIGEYFRLLWFLRHILGGLSTVFVALSALMYCAGGVIHADTHRIASPGEVVYFCAVTALTIGYGDIVATTATGRAVAIALGLLGVLVTGITTAAGVHAIQGGAQRIGLRAHDERDG
ncbi:potassium channel family protein [Paraburkholderia sp. JHI869]|uniref:potassium channel family protein n=1 Tax=Paraburkholderia sp. JHI869 TaxID=3112959 RepID=UPI003181E7D3